MKVAVRTPDNGDPCLSDWEGIDEEKVEVILSLREGGELCITEQASGLVRIELTGRLPNHFTFSVPAP